MPENWQKQCCEQALLLWSRVFAQRSRALSVFSNGSESFQVLYQTPLWIQGVPKVPGRPSMTPSYRWLLASDGFTSRLSYCSLSSKTKTSKKLFAMSKILWHGRIDEDVHLELQHIGEVFWKRSSWQVNYKYLSTYLSRFWQVLTSQNLNPKKCLRDPWFPSRFRSKY